MLKEAIEKIEELAKPTILEVDGKTFAVDCGGHATQILAPLFYPERKDLSSLDALTLMIREEAVPSYGKIFVNIPSPTCVHAFLSPNPDLREERMTIYARMQRTSPAGKRRRALRSIRPLLPSRRVFRNLTTGNIP